MTENSEVLNLSRQHLKKVDPAQANLHYSTLLLDHNELTRLENVETYSSLTKLSASHNQLVRMYGVARLYSLRVLNLSHNNIVSIEGLKDMKYLSSLNLAGNNIKCIEHLNNNIQLEHLDLSDNAICSISDLSHLKNLRKLHLHNNKIKTLQFCEKFLPVSLVSLTLADNYLSDLNEVSRLSHLFGLEQFTVMNNPCTTVNCDYRPFVLNWLMNLKLLDEMLVNPKEGLIAEWLYSQGKGRHFKISQHDELIQYLQSVKPEVLASNGRVEDGKLDKILNLARQHHSELHQQTVALVSPVPQRRLVARKSTPSCMRKQVTPPKDTSKLASKAISKTSCEEDPSYEPIPNLMCQSLDPSAAFLALERSASASQVTGRVPRPVSTPSQALVTDENMSEEIEIERLSNAPTPRKIATSNGNKKSLYQRSVSQNNGDSKIAKQSLKASSSKLPVQVQKKGPAPASPRVNELLKMNETHAAITIQKLWRGYHTRNLNAAVQEVKTKLRLTRAEQHVQLLAKELSQSQVKEDCTCHVALCEQQGKTVQMLQETCDQLQQQVRDLQESMQHVLEWMSGCQPVPRPRTLALKMADEAAIHPVENFAQGMAHHLIRCIGEQDSQLCTEDKNIVRIQSS